MFFLPYLLYVYTEHKKWCKSKFRSHKYIEINVGSAPNFAWKYYHVSKEPIKNSVQNAFSIIEQWVTTEHAYHIFRSHGNQNLDLCFLCSVTILVTFKESFGETDLTQVICKNSTDRKSHNSGQCHIDCSLKPAFCVKMDKTAVCVPPINSLII